MRKCCPDQSNATRVACPLRRIVPQTGCLSSLNLVDKIVDPAIDHHEADVETTENADGRSGSQ